MATGEPAVDAAEAGGLILGALSALWLGLLTSVSPCPLATNIAAVSFVGRRVGSPRRVLLAGLLYTAGRVLTYALLGILLVSAILSAPHVSHALQKYMNRILGPVLIIAGMFLLDLLSLGLSGSVVGEKLQKRAETWGLWGALALGVLFALSFCPISAALFFGSLVPLAAKCGSGFLMPALYGIGTGLPVLFFSVLIALGARSLGSAFDRLSRVEWWARRITGGVFITVGIYYSLAYIFGVFS